MRAVGVAIGLLFAALGVAVILLTARSGDHSAFASTSAGVMASTRSSW